MRLFLDTSVLLAASGSANGASRELFRLAPVNEWTLVTTPYVIEEVFRNLSSLGSTASADWARLRPALVLMDDVVTMDRPAVFEPARDRPILFSALAWGGRASHLGPRGFRFVNGRRVLRTARVDARLVPGAGASGGAPSLNGNCYWAGCSAVHRTMFFISACASLASYPRIGQVLEPRRPDVTSRGR